MKLPIFQPALALAFALELTVISAVGAESPLPKLFQLAAQSADLRMQLDILEGVSKALEGRSSVPAPEGWTDVEAVLVRSESPRVRALARNLALKFGSPTARKRAYAIIQNSNNSVAERRDALNSLLESGDPELAPLLHGLLDEPPLRSESLRALARYDAPETAARVLAVYPRLTGRERADALATLASRKSTAAALMQAVRAEIVNARDLSATVLRQLRSHQDPTIDQDIASLWGAFSESAPDKRKEIAKYKNIYRAGGSTPGDASRGRSVYTRSCQPCHRLFDVGGSVGPDLTGSNRRDLDYLLENIVDPNAVIPNDYRSSTLETKDGRVATGIVQRRDANSVSIRTQTETLVVPADNIATLRQDPVSMMPEGLLLPLTDQEIRDLLYYLRGPAQAPLAADAGTASLFFNGADLTNWRGDKSLWRVEDGAIVGQSADGLANNNFLVSEMIVGDFRLTCDVKLEPNSENSGIQFRSQPLSDGGVKGYQADIGQGWWGKLYEEHGRALLWDRPGDSHVRPNDWNRYEIVAAGDRILTALNGEPCVDLTDPEGARRGVIALQLHSGGPMTARFRNLRLEVNPEPVLKTAR